MVHERGEGSTCKIVDSRSHCRNKKVEGQAEQGRLCTTRKSPRTNGTTRYRLKDSHRAGAAHQIAVDAGIANVEGASDRAADKNWRDRAIIQKRR